MYYPKYVDDIIFGTTNEFLCKEFPKIVSLEFEMRANFILTIQVKYRSKGIFVYQFKYIIDFLKHFGLENTKKYPTLMIGRLFYLTATRSDIILSVWICAQFQSCPRTSHFNSHDKKLQILKGTIDLGLRYPKNISFHFLGYSNIVFAGCLTERKSTSGTCYFLVIL